MLYVAALLMALLGFAHSYLGERFILLRLFRRDSLPKLFGGTDFTQRTLRFAWHLTTVLAFGFAAVLILVARGGSSVAVVRTIGWCLVVAGLLPLIHTRGRHLSWIVLCAAGGLCLLWAAS